MTMPAIDHLSQVQKLTEDPFLVHLSRLIEGIVRERQGQDEEAVDGLPGRAPGGPRRADGDDDAHRAADEDWDA